MQEIFQVFVLAVVQGLTEFLPVSSSAHLILVPKLLHWQDQGLAFDAAIHLGTLAAVLLYFRLELTAMTKDWLRSLHTRQRSANSKLAWAIIFGTIPVGLCGLIFNQYISDLLRSTLLIATTTIIFGILLAIAAHFAKQQRNEYQLTWRDVIFIGCAQAIALIPGVSRSGITLTAGLFAGLTNRAAARFSFLLSIPVIVLAGGYEIIKMNHATTTPAWEYLGFGFLVAALTGYACIDLFLKLLDKVGVMPFVVYRIILGVVLLWAM